VDIAFDVGTGEVHTVAFSTGILNGKVTLRVDGIVTEQERFRFWIPLHRRVETEVGQNERHVVAVDVTFAKWSRKFKKPRVTAYVDDGVVGSLK
jgi:hypothetical protein